MTVHALPQGHAGLGKCHVHGIHGPPQQLSDLGGRVLLVVAEPDELLGPRRQRLEALGERGQPAVLRPGLGAGGCERLEHLGADRGLAGEAAGLVHLPLGDRPRPGKKVRSLLEVSRLGGDGKKHLLQHVVGPAEIGPDREHEGPQLALVPDE